MNTSVDKDTAMTLHDTRPIQVAARPAKLTKQPNKTIFGLYQNNDIMGGYSGSAAWAKLNQQNLDMRREKTYFKQDYSDLYLPTAYKKQADLTGPALLRAQTRIAEEKRTDRLKNLKRFLLALLFISGLVYFLLC